MATLDYSKIYDNKAPIIDDFVPEKMLRLYPYEMVNTNKTSVFIQANTTSIVSISQDTLDLTNEILKNDENGNKYFEVFADIQSQTVLDTASTTSVYGKQLKEEENFQCISNWYYEGEFETIKLGSTRFLPAIFTVGKPLNTSEYENGSQAVYVSSVMQEAKEGNLAYANDISPEGLYEFSMINITALEASYTNANILFTSQLSNATKPIVIVKDDNGIDATKSGFSIEVEKNAFLGSGGIKAKGYINGLKTDINVSSNTGLAPIKMTPVSALDKVTLFADWFDYDVVMPEYIARLFNNKNGQTLEYFKTIKYDGTPTSDAGVAFFSDAELNLIQDAIALSFLFGTSFSQVPRYTAAEAKNAGGGAKQGDIKGNTKFGYVNWDIVSLSNKDPIKVIDNLFENYQRLFPSANESDRYRALKQIVAALSRYIYSSYAIGKGQNSFNEVYLPWFLKPISPLGLKETVLPNDEINLKLDADIKYQLFSRYYDLENGKISTFKNEKMSEVKLIQTDRKLTLPQIPNTIQEINKLPLPGDISTNSSSDLMYIWLSPISEQSELLKLFLNDPTITVENNSREISYTTILTNPGVTLPKDSSALNQYIIDDYKRWNNSSEVTIKAIGTLVQTFGSQITIPKYTQQVTLTPSTNFQKDLSGWAKACYQAMINFGYSISSQNANVTFSLDESAWIVQKYDSNLGNEPRAAKFTNGINFNYQYAPGASVRMTINVEEFKMSLASEQIVNSVLNISGNGIIVNTQRNTIFDKNSWNNLIRNLLSINTSTLKIDFIETEGQTIDSISEIIISSLWTNYFRVWINGIAINVPAFNKDDETIGIQRILFT